MIKACLFECNVVPYVERNVTRATCAVVSRRERTVEDGLPVLAEPRVRVTVGQVKAEEIVVKLWNNKI